MTDEQFNKLLATLQPQQQAGAAEMQQIVDTLRPQHQKSAAALGPMKPLDMGPDKMRKLKKFSEWLEEAENRMTYI